MAARDLAAREVDHVAEQPADRRAHHVQDVEAARHDEFDSSLTDPSRHLLHMHGRD